MEEKRNFCIEFRNIHNMIKQTLEKEKPVDLKEATPLHGMIIGYLYENYGRDFFQKDLETEFHMRRSTASQILSLMEKNGLIERKSVEHDARLKKIVLTDKAIQIHNSAMKNFTKIENRIQSGLTEEETEVFFSLLDKIKTTLQ